MAENTPVEFVFLMLIVQLTSAYFCLSFLDPTLEPVSALMTISLFFSRFGKKSEYNLNDLANFISNYFLFLVCWIFCNKMENDLAQLGFFMFIFYFHKNSQRGLKIVYTWAAIIVIYNLIQFTLPTFSYGLVISQHQLVLNAILFEFSAMFYLAIMN